MALPGIIAITMNLYVWRSGMALSIYCDMAEHR